jgi:ABC-type glutathione transport system ATPase component
MSTEPLLAVRGLTKVYARRRGWRSRSPGHTALRAVDLSVERGEIVGVVGPSGSGKSTLARCVALFEEPDMGEIRLEGRDLRAADRRTRRRLRAEVQLIFQDAAASLNPRFTAGEALMEPLRVQARGTRDSRRRAAGEWLERVGLPAGSFAKRALEFSGGERQRLAIARALILEPRLLILDEALSGLDLSLQAQIGRLLLDLRMRLGLSAILISHDLTLTEYVAQEIAVMEHGAIVERGRVAELLREPRHPRTAELVRASRALRLGGGR